ncbi:hypothetical protein JCM8097_002381 [Rhodosporidiobolus ruineniae]
MESGLPSPEWSASPPDSGPPDVSTSTTPSSSQKPKPAPSSSSTEVRKGRWTADELAEVIPLADRFFTKGVKEDWDAFRANLKGEARLRSAPALKAKYKAVKMQEEKKQKASSEDVKVEEGSPTPASLVPSQPPRPSSPVLSTSAPNTSFTAPVLPATTVSPPSRPISLGTPSWTDAEDATAMAIICTVGYSSVSWTALVQMCAKTYLATEKQVWTKTTDELKARYTTLQQTLLGNWGGLHSYFVGTLQSRSNRLQAVEIEALESLGPPKLAVTPSFAATTTSTSRPSQAGLPSVVRTASVSAAASPLPFQLPVPIPAPQIQARRASFASSSAPSHLPPPGSSSSTAQPQPLFQPPSQASTSAAAHFIQHFGSAAGAPSSSAPLPSGLTVPSQTAQYPTQALPPFLSHAQSSARTAASSSLAPTSTAASQPSGLLSSYPSLSLPPNQLPPSPIRAVTQAQDPALSAGLAELERFEKYRFALDSAPAFTAAGAGSRAGGGAAAGQGSVEMQRSGRGADEASYPNLEGWGPFAARRGSLSGSDGGGGGMRVGSSSQGSISVGGVGGGGWAESMPPGPPSLDPFAHGQHAYPPFSSLPASATQPAPALAASSSRLSPRRSTMPLEIDVSAANAPPASSAVAAPAPAPTGEATSTRRSSTRKRDRSVSYVVPGSSSSSEAEGEDEKGGGRKKRAKSKAAAAEGDESDDVIIVEPTGKGKAEKGKGGKKGKGKKRAKPQEGDEEWASESGDEDADADEDADVAVMEEDEDSDAEVVPMGRKTRAKAKRGI